MACGIIVSGNLRRRLVRLVASAFNRFLTQNKRKLIFHPSNGFLKVNAFHFLNESKEVAVGLAGIAMVVVLINMKRWRPIIVKRAKCTRIRSMSFDM